MLSLPPTVNEYDSLRFYHQVEVSYRTNSLYVCISCSLEVMAKKEKKPKTAEQKARVAVKQTKKASQKEKKVKSRGTDDSDAEDIDLASVLEEYAKQVSSAPYFHLSCLTQLIPSANAISQSHRNGL